MLLTTLSDHLFDSALALVYPQSCAVCGDSVESRHDGVACAACWRVTHVFTGGETLCWKCGAFTRAFVARERRESVRCRRCDDDDFTAARACGFYEGALRASLLALKREPHLSSRLATLMFVTQQHEPIDRATLIIPVPLHPEREKERGFNQAEVLAAELVRRTGLPLNESCLARRAHTERHRSGMDRRARRKSVAGAFVVRRSESIVGERVLLVDDVFTTGATVSACATVLKEAGAEEVYVLTVARPRI